MSGKKPTTSDIIYFKAFLFQSRFQA